MIHAFPTHMTPEGIVIAPSRLEYMGIKDGVVCGGVWVEGRGGLRKCQENRKRNECEFQAPHLVLSPIPIDYWATTFTLQALLERKAESSSDKVSYADSVYGMSDALRLCGINILSEESAQVGYDLIAYNAVCELRDLREAGLRLLKKLTQDLNQHRPQSTGDSDRETIRQFIRVEHFRRLGKWVITRLAELQARLVHMDRIRFVREVDPWAALSVHGTGTTRDTHRNFVDPYDFAEPEFADRTPRYEDPLQAPSFLNEKVIEAGENSYYLTADDLSSRKLLRASYNDS